MSKRFFVHDLTEEDAQDIIPTDAMVFAAKPRVNPCIGCFGCWVKTPGQCVIHDRLTPTHQMFADCDELIIISRAVYGGYSPEIKAFLDRSIGYMLPYFRVLQGEMHHQARYSHTFKLNVHYYGDALTTEEKVVATQNVVRNAINLNVPQHTVYFHYTPKALKEVFR